MVEAGWGGGGGGGWQIQTDQNELIEKRHVKSKERKREGGSLYHDHLSDGGEGCGGCWGVGGGGGACTAYLPPPHRERDQREIPH